MNLISYIGIPYEARGELPHKADCWTLVRGFAKKELGIEYPDYMYDMGNNMRESARHIRREMATLGERWREVDKAMLGDILIFRMKGVPVHVGICIGDGQMLHTLAGRMSCIEPLEHWKDNLVGIYRWIGQ